MTNLEADLAPIDYGELVTSRKNVQLVGFTVMQSDYLLQFETDNRFVPANLIADKTSGKLL